MQALQGNGFSSGEDMPPMGKQSPSPPQQHPGNLELCTGTCRTADQG